MKSVIAVVLVIIALVVGVAFGPQLLQAVGAGCDPGAQRTCTCPDNEPNGFQFCIPEGRWSRCTCIGQMIKEMQKEMAKQ